MENTTYLHNHSVYSLFDGAQTIKEMVERAKELGCKNLALTDHGTMIGIPKFVAECKKNDIKPLIGVEIYMQNPDDIIENMNIVNKGHSCLYAVNNEGYTQLCHILSDSEKNQIRSGKSVYPITTFEILEKYVKRGDLIYTTACVGGYIPQVLYFNEKQNIKINEINKKLLECSSPEDTDYKLLCKEIDDIRLQLGKYAEDKKQIQVRTKQTYKKQEKAANKITGEDKEIALRNVEFIKNDIENAKNELIDINEKIKNMKGMLSLKNKNKDDIEKTHKYYKKLIKELEECVIIDDKQISLFADERLKRLTDIFGKENTYVEIQYHGLGMEEYTFNKMIGLAKKHDLKIVAANDAHMAVNTPENIKRRQILMAQRFEKWEDLRPDSKEYYLKSNDDVVEMLGSVYSKEIVIEAIKNADELAEKCNVNYDFGSHPPLFPNVPKGMTAAEYLKQESNKGKVERYPDGLNEEDEKRYRHELDVIIKMGFADYLLIVQDYIKRAKSFGKDTDYNVGPGRGSAAGCIVCYCLKITDVDPLKYGLLFERFLNPDRVSMPDIDVDFARGVRPPLIQYCKDVYGENNVCQISTIGTQKAKKSTRNYANVLAAKYCMNTKDKDIKEIKRKYAAVASQINDKIPRNDEQGRDCTLKECKEFLDKEFCNNKIALEIIDGAALIEDIPTQYGIHAAGVIITDGKDINNYLPLRQGKLDTSGDDDEFDADTLVLGAQCDKIEAEYVFGLLKMDFLGLRTLNIISQCGEMIKERYGIVIDYDNIPIEQQVINEIYAKANTTGVFQFESPGAKKILKDFKPNSFEDLILINAANRPGPIEYIPEAIEVKKGAKQPYYMISEMKTILDETYGKPFYQEQLMQLFSVCAGFSMGEADIIRRYMSKKKVDKFMAYKDKFINGCVEKGAKKEDAEDFWNSIVSFSKYAFNKSHATTYTWVSYQTAWLKYHYPEEFICANINYDDGNKKDFMGLIQDDCRRMGIKILCPNINIAKTEYSVIDNRVIMAGFSNIKGMKSEAVSVLNARIKNRGYFQSVKDYVCTGITGKFVEKMIMCGAFDCFNDNRTATLEYYDNLCKQKELMDKAFDTYMKAEDEYRTEYYTYEVLNGEYEMQEALMSNKADKSKKKEIMNINKLKKQYKEAKEIYKKQTAIFNMLDYPEVDDSFNCAEEKNLLGLYITKTPLSGYPEPSEIGCIAIADINVADNIKILANITEIKEILTKKGEKMAFINCEDNSGTLSAVIFPKIWSKFYTAISTGVVYILTGRYEIKDGKSSFIINDINESLTNGEDLLVHVDSWKEWNTKYYPEAIKKSSINGSTLYVHNRKSGQIIRFSKKIKNFSNFKEAKYAFIHK